MKRTDYWIILLLIALCGLFYWRLFTFNDADALSFTDIDFTTIFTPWTSYSVERFHEGELPLWNPYMYAGTPFMADPQSAVFYPVRWLTTAALAFDSDITNGDVLFALEGEMLLHVIAGALFMYAFLRQRFSPLPGCVGALIWTFGGFMTSYPPAQLSILESSIWIPLVLLGIHRMRGVNGDIDWRWVITGGVFFGLSILAGHPQISMMTTYLAAAYLIYRLWGLTWSRVLLVLLIFMVIGIGLSAIQALPTAEYQMHTTRADFGIDHKGSGFQFHEPGMILFPRILGDWSPLYIGIISLALVGLALWRGGEGFWVGTAIVSLLLAFGQRTVVYSIFYVLVPGFTFFRFQERAVVILTVAAAVLAAHGAQLLLDAGWDRRSKRYVIGGWTALVIICGIFAGVFFVERLGRPDDSIENASAQSAMLAFWLSLASLFILWRMLQGNHRWGWAMAALLIFDLFSINMNNPFNFDPIPAHERLGEPDYVSIIRDNVWNGQTVDGMRGIGNSYGTLYRVPDTFGNGPLRPKALEFYLYQLAPERRWELLGVQVVTSGEDDLPVPNEWIGTGQDGGGRFNIHRLTNPRAFALLYYDSERVSNPEAAWDEIADPAFPLRETVIIEEDLPDDLSGAGAGQINLLTFEPEYIELQTETDSPAVASFALPYVTGWQATVDGDEVEVLRTFGGLTGVYLESGQHRIVLRYMPDTLIVGAAITGITLLGVIGALMMMLRRRDTRISHNHNTQTRN